MNHGLQPVPQEVNPNLAGCDANSPTAYGPHAPVSVAQFVADVWHLTERIERTAPDCDHVINLCSDRYRFMVGFVASILTRRTSLLPSSQTSESLRQMAEFAPHLLCIREDDAAALPGSDIATLNIATLPSDRPATVAASLPPLPAIPAEQLVAYVFTSGSTGQPQAHPKTWGKLFRNASAAIQKLGLDSATHNIVATVPPQHMYGFESSVLLNLIGHCPTWRGRPFYPADIAAALAAVPEPRLLVTTPFHLRTLLEAGIALPPVQRILSATASLPESLAAQAEVHFCAPVEEIYGCTETGQIATRRVTQSPLWSLMRDIELRSEGDNTFASGGHIESEIRLGDVIEQHAGRRFRLLGRHSDLINIAGKRTTLGYLNQQLLAIDGVTDGCFHMPDDSVADQSARVTRLCALVVAPALSQTALMDALRQRIDPVFLPRPLIRLDTLPRNSTGKLGRAEITALIDRHAATTGAHDAATPGAS